MPLRQQLLLALVIAVALPAVAPAQRMLRGPAPDRDPTFGVYVRDSAIAGEKLALAERMERLKEWEKSADVYQEIVEKYADRVVASNTPAPAPDGAAAAPQRYHSVTMAVQERLGKWPEEGLAMYRARYESPAATLRESAGVDDAAALSRVVQLYFPTDAAKAAAMRLIELYIESGEFTAAAWMGQRMLANHPALGADRAQLLFRTALAEHLGGNAAAARTRLEELKAKHPDAKGTVRGEEVALASELEKILASPAAIAHGTSNDSWPILGGDATRGRVPSASARPGTKLVEIPFIRYRQRPTPNVDGRALNAAERRRRESGMPINVMPVVDRGEIFYQDNQRVHAKGMESGFTLPGWTMTYGTDPAGPGVGVGTRQRFAPAGAILSSNAQLNVTVTDSSVLAVTVASRGIVASDMGMVMVPDGDNPLVCLDRATGERRWSTAPRHFPDALANLRSLEMGGSPLVVGDNVYIAARGGKPNQFDDSYVLCFNLADGKVRWACYLASGNAQNFQRADAGGEVGHLAYSGGRVYAVTNLGAVAAIDAYSGTIAWLSLYPRPQQAMNNNGIPMGFGGGQIVGVGGPRRPWAQNPAIVKDGRLFCLPSDAQHVIVYDAASGDEVKRVAMADFDNANTIVGVTSDRLVLTSDNEVFCVNWPKYEPKKRDESLHWYSKLAGEGATEEENKDTVRGRGFVTTESVFVPTKWNLRRLSLANGRAEQTYPSSGSWPTGEGPGNVIVTGDQIVVAGADGITIYSDLALARAKLDRAIEAAPNDPLPRLMYAETLFAAGQVDAAIEKLDAAIQLLGGLNSMRPGAERERAFARSLTFAERVAQPKQGASDPVRAAELFDRAASAASSPAQHVAYRLSRARFARTQRDFTNEVRLYQDILANPAWRTVIVPSEDGTGTVQAATLAEDAIRDRVRDLPAVYAQFEQAASEQLAIARQAKDPAQMMAVAQVYPNAKVAPEAMLAAADAYEAAGQHRPATQVLNEAYRKYHDHADKARIIEAQARNYLKLPNGLGVAIGRLTEGMKLQNSPSLKQALVLPDGEKIDNVTFGAAAEMLQRYSARVAAAALPDFNIPPWKSGSKRKAFLPETPETIIHGVDLLLVPPRDLRDSAARHDRVVTWSRTGGLSVYAVGTNKPLGNSASINRQPLGMAWMGKDLLVWTAERLVLLKGDQLETGWEVSVKGLPQVDVVDAAEAISRVDDVRPPRGVPVGPGLEIINNQVVQVGGNVNVVVRAARINAMARAREAQQQAERIEHVRPLGDRVIFATSAGRIAAVDQASGQLAWQTRTGEAPLEQVVANDDFVAARYTDDSGPQLVALETFGGQVVLRTTFSNETAPLNIQLAPDGTLLYTRPDRICGKDLYEPGNALKFGQTPTADGNRIFEGASNPDQIVIAEGRIYAVADNGQFVRVLSLIDGREVGNRLGTEATDWNVRLRVVGPRLYVFNSKTVTSYHVDRDDETWTGLVDSFEAPTIRDAFLGKQHVVLLDQPTPPGAEPAGDVSTRFRLLAYGRYPTAPGRQDESGKFDQSVDVTHPVGINLKQWQPVEGGFYYRSVDGKAHFLKGSGVDQAK